MILFTKKKFNKVENVPNPGLVEENNEKESDSYGQPIIFSKKPVGISEDIFLKETKQKNDAEEDLEIPAFIRRKMGL